MWDRACDDQGSEPDVVMASAGDIPTQETLAAVVPLRKEFPDRKIRYINVVDLFKLQPSTEHPHGLSDQDFDALLPLRSFVIAQENTLAHFLPVWAGADAIVFTGGVGENSPEHPSSHLRGSRMDKIEAGRQQE